jgi:hypothetical protein
MADTESQSTADPSGESPSLGSKVGSFFRNLNQNQFGPARLSQVIQENQHHYDLGKAYSKAGIGAALHYTLTGQHPPKVQRSLQESAEARQPPSLEAHPAYRAGAQAGHEAGWHAGYQASEDDFLAERAKEEGPANRAYRRRMAPPYKKPGRRDTRDLRRGPTG